MSMQSSLTVWRPCWLSSMVLLFFCCVFLSVAVALPIMRYFSKTNDGLGSARDSRGHVWRFGPTAAITILSVFWGRVKLQLVRYTSWWNIRDRHPVNGDKYLLDYTEMLLPTVLMQSLKRKHFLGTIVTAMTLLVELQIVLSPIIYQMASTSIERPTEARILDSFSEKRLDEVTDTGDFDGTGNVQSALLVKATVEGVRRFSIPLPFGVSNTFAYQTFSPVSTAESPVQRPSVDAPLVVVVDGIFMEAECLMLESQTLSVDPDGNGYAFKMKFEGCDTLITKRGKVTLPHQWDSDGRWDDPQPGEWNDRPCSALPQHHPQKLFFAGNRLYDEERDEYVSVCAAVLCSGYSTLSKVKVVDDGLRPNITMAENKGPGTAFNIDPWAIMTEKYDKFGITEEHQGLDAWPLQLYYNLLDRPVNISDVSLYNSSMLYEAAMSMVTYLGPLTVHTYLKDQKRA